MLIGEERAGADRVADQWREIEDLSKVKGPWKWARSVSFLAMLFMIASVIGWYQHADESYLSKILVWIFFFALSTSLAITFFMMSFHNYKLWWYTEDGRLKVTTKDPMFAQGLVIEVWTKTRPSTTLYWGPKRWKYMDATHISNNSGEVRLAPSPELEAEEGLTPAVWTMLHIMHGWKIIPQEHGRVLRLVDYTGLCRYIPCDSKENNLQEVLSSRNWEDYDHKQAQQIIELKEKKARADKVLDEVRERLLAFWDDVAARRVHPRITMDSTRLEYALLQLIRPLFFSGSSGNAEQNLARFDSVCAELRKFEDGRRRVENPFKLKKDPAPIADNGSASQGAVKAS